MKPTLYTVYWTRQTEKIKKEGTTHVVAEGLDTAIVLFRQQYPDRVPESVYREGDDLILPEPLIPESLVFI